MDGKVFDAGPKSLANFESNMESKLFFGTSVRSFRNGSFANGTIELGKYSFTKALLWVVVTL
jgi:hypothetical protein